MAYSIVILLCYSVVGPGDLLSINFLPTLRFSDLYGLFKTPFCGGRGELMKNKALFTSLPSKLSSDQSGLWV